MQIEAESVEDEGICFNVYIYNVQPGIEIDYATGESREADDAADMPEDGEAAVSYIVNTNTGKFHRADCASAADISDKNRLAYDGDRQKLIDAGYEPCKRCNP